MADYAYAQGDIVWAYYPLTDKIDKHKKRPVLIISNKTSNDLDNDYIVLPITRAIRSEPFSVLIDPASVKGNLPVASEVRCNKPFTVRQSLLLEKIGELATEKVQVASAYMCQSIRVN
ncbi:mRNA interferase MazF [Spirosoma oryzae]|uniref:mRNA interferase MazF n=1 Tax=Spirosoma oryzae TaxID=1469603 RepID=A0A2T0S3Z9_9BACT|nr:type II toxin-antitoxin system PemK/MazF family toxin [Spirosoma oryzae]PRY28150.1 mRNA interferase MazF [Spirosoma oryzae]